MLAFTAADLLAWQKGHGLRAKAASRLLKIPYMTYRSYLPDEHKLQFRFYTRAAVAHVPPRVAALCRYYDQHQALPPDDEAIADLVEDFRRRLLPLQYPPFQEIKAALPGSTFSLEYLPNREVVVTVDQQRKILIGRNGRVFLLNAKSFCSKVPRPVKREGLYEAIYDQIVV